MLSYDRASSLGTSLERSVTGTISSTTTESVYANGLTKHVGSQD